MMSVMSTGNKKIAQNTIALYIRMIVQMLIGLYTSRVVLQVLGVDDFGIYNVVGSVTAMFSFVNGAMSNATMRFITFELGRRDEKRLNEVFCTSVNIHLIIAVITILILDTAGIWFLYNKMTISPHRIVAAFWVLQFSIVTCIINIINVPYNACIIAHEKMGAFAFLSLFQSITILLFVMLLTSIDGDKLILYALILMIVQMIIQIMYWIYCRKNFSETSYNIIWKKDIMKEMARFAGWTMNGNIAWLAYTQGLNILINVFFGPAVNAARGIAYTVQSKIVGFCDSFQIAVSPQITKSLSVGDYDRMHFLILNSSRFSFYLLLVLSLPVYVGLDEILRLWLGIVPKHTANFVRIILFCSAVDVLRNPLNSAVHATGNIKKYQLWEANTLLLIIPLAYVLLKMGYSAEWAFGVQLFIFVIVQIERIIIVCPQIRMKKNTYFKELIIPVVKVLLLSIIIPCIIDYCFPIKEGEILQLLLSILITIINCIVCVYLFGLKNTEKEKVCTLFISKIRALYLNKD